MIEQDNIVKKICLIDKCCHNKIKKKKYNDSSDRAKPWHTVNVIYMIITSLSITVNCKKVLKKDIIDYGCCTKKSKV